MKNKRQIEKQNVLLLAGNEIVGLTLPAEPDYIVSTDSLEAWERDVNQQARDKKGHNIQVVSDVDKKPLVIFKDRPVVSGQTTAVIAYEAQEEALTVLDNRRQKNHMLVWVGIICAVLALTFAIAVLLKIRGNAEAPPTAFIPLMMAAFPGIKKGSRLDRFIFGKRDGHYDEERLNTLSKIKDESHKTCLVVVEATGVLEEDIEISAKLVPSESIERKYKGKPCHLLNLSAEGKLTAIEPPLTRKKDQSPAILYTALQCEREVDETYWLGESILEKIKIGLLIALCLALMFVIFLIAASSGGA